MATEACGDCPGWQAGPGAVMLCRACLEAENEHLKKLINTPHVKNFLEAVRCEAAHQQLRWKAEHDAGKTDADWFWLLGYLAGKAIRPGQTLEKRLHHIIATAAVCLNWHRHAVRNCAPAE